MSPDLPQLVLASRSVAAAIGVASPTDAELESFLRGLLFGDRDLWAAWRAGAHAARPEPDATRWGTADHARAFELGLYGRAAQRTAWDDEVDAKRRGG